MSALVEVEDSSQSPQEIEQIPPPSTPIRYGNRCPVYREYVMLPVAPGKKCKLMECTWCFMAVTKRNERLAAHIARLDFGLIPS